MIFVPEAGPCVVVRVGRVKQRLGAIGFFFSEERWLGRVDRWLRENPGVGPEDTTSEE